MKKLVKILPVILVAVFVMTNVFAGVIDPAVGNGKPNQTVTTVANNLWSTVFVVVQILAIAAVVFAGLRYMFASADQKADIKKSMGILIVGAILVFAAATIINLVTDIGKDVLTV